MTDQRERLTFEPFLAVFVGLILAKLVVPRPEKWLLDLLLAATLLVGGLGRPFAARRRWWLVAAGVLAIAVVGGDAWLVS